MNKLILFTLPVIVASSGLKAVGSFVDSPIKYADKQYAISRPKAVTAKECQQGYYEGGYSVEVDNIVYGFEVEPTMSSTGISFYCSYEQKDNLVAIGNYSLTVDCVVSSLEVNTNYIIDFDTRDYADSKTFLFSVDEIPLNGSEVFKITDIAYVDFPIDGGGEIDLTAKPDPFGDIARMWNSTFTNSDSFKLVSLENEYTDLIKELEDAGIQTLKYTSGMISENKMITLLEDVSGDVYIYVYRRNSSYEFDRVDLSTIVTPDITSDVFTTYKLQEVASTSYIVKYLIRNLGYNKYADKRRYAVRQVYSSDSKNVISSIIAVALEYLVAKGDDGIFYSQVRAIDSFVVIDKKVAFELKQINADDCIDIGVCDSYLHTDVTYSSQFYRQSSYIAFSTDIDIESILNVQIKFTNSVVSGHTSVGHDLLDYNCDKFIKKFKGIESFTTSESSDPVTKTVKIEPKNVNYVADLPWFFKKTLTSYNTISRPADVSNISDNLKKYDWVVRFNESDLFGYVNFKFVGPYEWNVRGYNDITDVSLMTITYQQNGEIRQALFIDTYADSEGNVPVSPSVPKNLLHQIFDAFSNVFAGTGSVVDWVLVIVSSIVFILFLGITYKIIQSLVSTLKLLFRRAK